MTELTGMSAVETAESIRRHEVSCAEVLEGAIQRIEALNPHLNALVFTDFEEARGRAEEADRAVRRGDDLGPLHGVPTAIKDLFDFKPGWPATMGGIPALKDFSMPISCMWAERMEAAGAIIVGKTNSPVMGFRGTCDNPLFGPSHNPFDTSLNTGGSSGGSAAAVASGMLPFAEGTDGGGSVRIPAAWCGLVGYKQSWGRVPLVMRPNGFGATNPFVFEGILARSVADVTLGLSALSGPHPGDPFAWQHKFDDLEAHNRGVRGLRVAYSRDFGGFPVAPGVAAVVDEAVGAFEEAGATVSEVDTRLPRDQFELGELWCRIIAPLNIDTFDQLRAGGIDMMGEHRDQLPAPLLRYLDELAGTTVPEFTRMQHARTEVFDFVQSFFLDHDLLVTPTLAVPPVPNTDDGETIGPSEVNGVRVDPCIGWCLTYPLNFTGHPAASVPAGMLDGLPVGMQVVGRLGDDAGVLAALGAVERVRPWAHTYDEVRLG